MVKIRLYGLTFPSWVLNEINEISRIWCTRHHAQTSHTCPNNFFDFDRRDIDLFGELSHGFVGVFVGKGVDVDLHPRRARQGRAAHGRVAVGQIGSQSQF